VVPCLGCGRRKPAAGTAPEWRGTAAVRGHRW
jgi:hypothetical protein